MESRKPHEPFREFAFRDVALVYLASLVWQIFLDVRRSVININLRFEKESLKWKLNNEELIHAD